MTTTRFESGVQPGFRLTTADMSLEPGGGEEFFSGTGDITELVVPSGAFRFPALKFHGVAFRRDYANYDQQQGGGTLQSFVIRIYDNGVAVGPTITFFDTGNEIPDANGNDMAVVVDIALGVMGDITEENLQHVDCTMIVTNRSTSAEVKRETKSWCLSLEQDTDHDIGYGIRKGIVGNWTTPAGGRSNNFKMRSFTGWHIGQRSGS